MGALIFIAVILGIGIIILIYEILKSIKRKEWVVVIGMTIIYFFCIFFEIGIISCITNTQPKPTALDVYRGLTELEITSDNGVPQDTVVVFKK
jgi:hypothetical protein